MTRVPVYCLVRGKSEADALERIHEALRQYKIDIGNDSSRVIAVPGDLSQTDFGQSEEGFLKLAAEITSIYHCAATNNWVYPYHMLKAVNVSGTHRLIRLAWQKRVKAFHFVSTVGVFSSKEYENEFVSEQEELDHSGPLRAGIAQSKWIAERAVQYAREAGIPTVVYRPSDLGSHSSSLAFNAKDHMCLMISGCIQFGKWPEMDRLVDAVPVDFAAKALVRISQKDGVTGRTFHLTNPVRTPMNEIGQWLRELGYPLDVIPYTEWVRELKQHCRSYPGNALAAILPFFSDAVLDNSPLPRFCNGGTLDMLTECKLECPPLDRNLLRSSLIGLVREGYLPAPVGNRIAADSEPRGVSRGSAPER